MDYKTAGVDVEAGDQLVDWLRESGPRTDLPKDWPSFLKNSTVDGIGGFAAISRFRFPEMKKPCLVTCTDGVGTKVKLASQFKFFQGVGQDLVAMCVNDLICCGAEPFLFLDYYATGKLALPEAKEFLSGVRKACEESMCLLVGGETAEMPGVYHDGDFDCAGFSVGVVDEDNTLGPHLVKAGDVLIGVSSSGFHSNGYSLLRKVFEKDLAQWKDILLTPTALYPRLARALKKSFEGRIHALAHITGGGVENIPRVFPKGLGTQLRPWAWPQPFLEVQSRTGMSREKMLKTLNCGLGLVVVAEPSQAQGIRQLIEAQGFRSFEIGVVEKSDHELGLEGA